MKRKKKRKKAVQAVAALTPAREKTRQWERNHPSTPIIVITDILLYRARAVVFTFYDVILNICECNCLSIDGDAPKEGASWLLGLFLLSRRFFCCTLAGVEQVSPLLLKFVPRVFT